MRPVLLCSTPRHRTADTASVNRPAAGAAATHIQYTQLNIEMRPASGPIAEEAGCLTRHSSAWATCKKGRIVTRQRHDTHAYTIPDAGRSTLSRSSTCLSATLLISKHQCLNTSAIRPATANCLPHTAGFDLCPELFSCPHKSARSREPLPVCILRSVRSCFLSKHRGTGVGYRCCPLLTAP